MIPPLASASVEAHQAASRESGQDDANSGPQSYGGLTVPGEPYRCRELPALTQFACLFHCATGRIELGSSRPNVREVADTSSKTCWLYRGCLAITAAG